MKSLLQQEININPFILSKMVCYIQSWLSSCGLMCSHSNTRSGIRMNIEYCLLLRRPRHKKNTSWHVRQGNIPCHRPAFCPTGGQGLIVLHVPSLSGIRVFGHLWLWRKKQIKYLTNPQPAGQVVFFKHSRLGLLWSRKLLHRPLSQVGHSYCLSWTTRKKLKLGRQPRRSDQSLHL